MSSKARPLYEELRRVDAGRVRRLGLDRQALPPPGRDRHAVGAHDRPPDARGRHDHDPRPRLARAGADPDRRAHARCSLDRLDAPWQPRGRRDVGWHELAIESEALRGQPARRPADAAALRLDAAAYDADPDRRFPSIYVLQGMTGQARAWFNVSPFAEDAARAASTRPALEADRRARRRASRRSAARSSSTRPRSAATAPTSARRSSPFVDARFRTLPEAAHRGLAGQVVGRVRRDGLGACCGPTSSAASRPTRATRCSRSRSRRSFRRRRRRCGTTTTARTTRSGRTSARAGPCSRTAADPAAPERLRHGRGLLADRRRLGRAALPARHRRARARGVGALARLGPGAARPRARRGAARRARRSGSTPAGTTSTTSTSARGVPPGRARPAGGRGRVHFELYEGATAARPGAIRSASRSSPSGSPRRRRPRPAGDRS